MYTPNGSGLIMADSHSGIQAFAAAGNNTLYVSTSSVPENWFVNGNASHLKPGNGGDILHKIH